MNSNFCFFFIVLFNDHEHTLLNEIKTQFDLIKLNKYFE